MTDMRGKKPYFHLKSIVAETTDFAIGRAIEYWEKLYPRLKPFLDSVVAFVNRTVERHEKLSLRSKSLLHSALGFAIGSLLAYFAFGIRGALFVFVVCVTYFSGKLFLKIFAPDI
jgi:hypothetical protein